MTPEEFDMLIKQKIGQLHHLPELECDEEKMWQNVCAKLGGSTSGLLLPLSMALLCCIGLYLWKSEPNSQTPKALPLAVSSHQNGKQQSVCRKEARRPAPKTVIAKTRSVVPFLGKKSIAAELPLLEQEARDEIASIPAAAPHERPITKPQDSLPQVSLPTVSPSASHVPAFREVYLGIAGKDVFAGTRWVHALSRKTSIAYGLGIRQALLQPALPRLQLSAEGRYYLLQKESRFTAFVYGQLATSFSSIAPMVYIEAGGEARFRLTPKKAAHGAFLFIRMPAYQKTIFPGMPAP